MGARAAPRKFAERLISLYNSGFFGSRVHRKFRPPKNAKSKRDKLMYYFFVLSVDYGMRAEPLFRRMRELHEKSKEWFSPEFLRKAPESRVVEKMKELKMRFPAQAAKRWKLNSAALGRMDDRIESVFEGTTNEVLEKIAAFHGFGPKLSRLLLRAVVDEGVIPAPEGFEKMELPTDVHVTKIAIRSGLIGGRLDNYQKSVPEARKKWTEVAEMLGVMPADLDRALWVLGAEWCSKKRCSHCPLREFCLLPADTS